jgi:hypothetical protein
MKADLPQVGAAPQKAFSADLEISASSTDSTSSESDATFSSNETTHGQDSFSASQHGGASNGYNDQDSASFTGQDTVTGSDTQTQTSLTTESLYESGSFANDSYNLSSFALLMQGPRCIEERVAARTQPDLDGHGGPARPAMGLVPVEAVGQPMALAVVEHDSRR